MGNFRLLAAVASLAIVGALVPFSAHAEGDCTSNIVIFSSNSEVGLALNSNAAACLIDPDQNYDGRIINPASDQISLRYTSDLGAAVPSITAVLNGMGFHNKSVTLTRAPVQGNEALGFYYNSTAVVLPDGISASGCVTAHIGGDIDEGNSFHTVDSAC